MVAGGTIVAGVELAPLDDVDGVFRDAILGADHS
jgi:hypothetical protein